MTAAAAPREDRRRSPPLTRGQWDLVAANSDLPRLIVGRYMGDRGIWGEWIRDRLHDSAVDLLISAARCYRAGGEATFRRFARGRITAYLGTRTFCDASPVDPPGTPVDPLEVAVFPAEPDDGLEELTSGLTAEERSLLALVFRDDLTQAEAGKRLGISQSKAMYLLARSREHLAWKLAGSHLDPRY